MINLQNRIQRGRETWVSGGGAGRAIRDVEGFSEDRRERQGVPQTAGLDFAEDGGGAAGGWSASSGAAVGCGGGGRHCRRERGQRKGGYRGFLKRRVRYRKGQNRHFCFRRDRGVDR